MTTRKRPLAPPPNPFWRLSTSSIRIQAFTVDDRLLMVRGFSVRQCLQALRVPGLQTTVRRAVRQRMADLGIDLDELDELRGEEHGR